MSWSSSWRRLLCLAALALLSGGRTQAALVDSDSSLTPRRPADEYYSHRSALLLKVHDPTAAMVERLCHLSVEAAASSFKVAYFVQYYVEKEKQQNHSAWCGGGLQVYTLRKSDLVKAFGEETGGALHKNRHHLGSAHEIAFHARHRRKLKYDFLWVVEQDVAWQGNLFDALSTYATWHDDYLCQSPYNDTLATAGNSLMQQLFQEHSGWGDRFPVHRKCYIFVARYSRRMLSTLADKFVAQGHWAQGEWFAATVCAFHTQLGTEFGLGSKGLLRWQSGGESSACSMRDFMSEAYLFDRRCFSYKRRATCPKAHTWAYSMHKPFSFFHPVKF